jgi:hypothetical protein
MATVAGAGFALFLAGYDRGKRDGEGVRPRPSVPDREVKTWA